MLRRVTLVAFVFVLAVGVPAVAGNEDDPEIVDPCGPTEIDERVYPGAVPWADVCAGWFETLETEERVVLRTTLQLAGNVGERVTATGWSMAWELADGCQGTWAYAEHASRTLEPPEPYASFAIRCPVEPAYLFGYPWHTRFYSRLPLDVVEEDGDRIVVTLAFDGALAGAAADHQPGAVLAAPTATTWVDFHLGLIYMDLTEPGRDYTIGSP